MVDVIEAYNVTLCPVEEADLEQLRQWRNSAEIAQQMVSQEKITPQQQLHWYQQSQTRKDQQHFAIRFRHQLIGAANIKSLNGNAIMPGVCLEPGIYIGEQRYRSNILAFAPSLALLDYCFDTLRSPLLKAKVKVSNQSALSYNFKLGYVEVDKENEADKENDYIHIELAEPQYQLASKNLKHLLSRKVK